MASRLQFWGEAPGLWRKTAQYMLDLPQRFDKIIHCSSYQHSSCVLIHMNAVLQLQLPICTIDTRLLPRQTNQLRRQYDALFGTKTQVFRPILPFHTQQQLLGTDRPWATHHGKELCCLWRKQQPFDTMLKQTAATAVIFGLLRTERPCLPEVTTWHAIEDRSYTRIHPLCQWTRDDVEEYMDHFRLPKHALIATENYGSLGCTPCTTPLLPGETNWRAGRWRHLEHVQFCGMHATDSKRDLEHR
jgi:phosphoadenosine phosphosulfate reductase